MSGFKVIIAADSFKGSLSAFDATAAIARGILRVDPDIYTIQFPIADGGEGTLAIIAARESAELSYFAVPGADGATLRAPYCVIKIEGRDCAVIESATIVGMIQASSRGVLDRSTRGIGCLIKHLLDRGIRHFVLALGGSATNDGGAGMLAELGARFVDASNTNVEPTPRGLLCLARVELRSLDPRLAETRMIALADVNNPLAGPLGATRTFGPQKGLPADDVERVDQALAHVGALGDAALAQPFSQQAGSGAAGGLGYAVRILGGSVEPGAAWLGQRYDLAGQIANADWVITGEGRSDAQTLHGKAPLYVATVARAARVPVSLISGRVDASAWPDLSRLFIDYRALASHAGDVRAIEEAALRLENAAAELARLRVRGKSNRDNL